MTLVPRRFCAQCSAILVDDRCKVHGFQADLLSCRATNAAGDVCTQPQGHRYPHTTAVGLQFTADQSDSEIGALVRAAFARHESQPGCFVELESVEAVEVTAVIGPGVVEIEAVQLRVTSRAKLKGAT
jgi:hypothetical protein